jgi:dTDP-4-amino-4,6-dideoxygalactose transaminase
MIYYPVPLHRQPLYAPDNAGRKFPVTDEAARTVLSLPIFPHLGAERAKKVAGAVRACS